MVCGAQARGRLGRARQLAPPFGGPPAGGAPAPGKQDARKIAAERLDAGVSHTTLEKLLWLRHLAFGVERREAMGALEAVDGGEPGEPYERAHTLVLIDNLEPR